MKTATQPPRTANQIGTSIAEAADQFARSQHARHLSPKTILLYREAINTLARHLAAKGMPSQVEHLRREHIEDHIATRLTQVASSTTNMEYRALSSYFHWAVDEEIIPSSPLAKMHPPKVSVVPPPVLDKQQIQALLNACKGKDFADRRDMAIVMLLIDCGLRRSEVGNLTIDDVDRHHSRVYVTGKGDKGRYVTYGGGTAVALDRYFRARTTQQAHRRQDDTTLFLGKTIRRFGPSGIGQALAYRSRKAGLGRINPHRLRHTAAHVWLSTEGQEGDLVTIMGWSPRSAHAMLQRYGASAASDRAAKAQQKRSIATRLGVEP